MSFFKGRHLLFIFIADHIHVRQNRTWRFFFLFTLWVEDYRCKRDKNDFKLTIKLNLTILIVIETSTGRQHSSSMTIGISRTISTKRNVGLIGYDTCIPLVATCVSYETCFDFLSFWSNLSHRRGLFTWHESAAARGFGKSSTVKEKINNRRFMFGTGHGYQIVTYFAINDTALGMIHSSTYILRETSLAVTNVRVSLQFLISLLW